MISGDSYLQSFALPPPWVAVIAMVGAFQMIGGDCVSGASGAKSWVLFLQSGMDLIEILLLWPLNCFGAIAGSLAKGAFTQFTLSESMSESLTEFCLHNIRGSDPRSSEAPAILVAHSSDHVSRCQRCLSRLVPRSAETPLVKGTVIFTWKIFGSWRHCLNTRRFQ